MLIEDFQINYKNLTLALFSSRIQSIIKSIQINKPHKKMSILTTGKRFYNINKNIESQHYNSQSNRFSHFRNISDIPPIPKSDFQEPYLSQLKQTLESQDNRIQELQTLLEKPMDQSLKHSESEAINSSIIRPEISTQFYKNHVKDLEKQLEEKNRQRIMIAINREKEIKNRLKQLSLIRQSQLHEKISHLKKAEEYRNHLEVQKQFRDQIEEKQIIENEFYSPLVHFRSGHTKSQEVIKSVPELSRDEVFPKTKNLNRLAVMYSELPAFQQPRYTKFNPKVVPSFPVIGSKTKLRQYENF